MKCERVRKFLLPYEEGELSSDLIREVASHLSSCPNCSNELDSIRLFLSSLREPLPDPGEEYWKRFPSLALSRLRHDETRPGWLEGLRTALFPDLRRLAYAVSGASAIIIVTLFIILAPWKKEHLAEPLTSQTFSREDISSSVYSLSDPELSRLSEKLSSEFETMFEKEESEMFLDALESFPSEFVLSLSRLSDEEFLRLEEELEKFKASKERS